MTINNLLNSEKSIILKKSSEQIFPQLFELIVYLIPSNYQFFNKNKFSTLIDISERITFISRMNVDSSLSCLFNFLSQKMNLFFQSQNLRQQDNNPNFLIAEMNIFWGIIVLGGLMCDQPE